VRAAPTYILTPALHDALPISVGDGLLEPPRDGLPLTEYGLDIAATDLLLEQGIRDCRRLVGSRKEVLPEQDVEQENEREDDPRPSRRHAALGRISTAFWFVVAGPMGCLPVPILTKVLLLHEMNVLSL